MTLRENRLEKSTLRRHAYLVDDVLVLETVLGGLKKGAGLFQLLGVDVRVVAQAALVKLVKRVLLYFVDFYALVVVVVAQLVHRFTVLLGCFKELGQTKPL